MEFGFQSSFLKGYSLSLWELSLHRHDSHTSDHLCHRFRPAGGGEEPQQERSRAGAPARLPVLNQSKRRGSAALRSLCCFNAPGTKRLSCLYEWMNTNSMICLQASPPPPPLPVCCMATDPSCHIHTSSPGSDFLFPLRGYLVWPFPPMSEVNYQKYEQNKPPLLGWSGALGSGRPRTKTNRTY